jgi:hypothetical protein
MRRFTLLIWIFLGCFTLSCAAGSMAYPDQSRSPDGVYADKVIAIDRLAGDVVAVDGFRYDEEFVELANEGAQHIDDCIRFLSEQGHTPQQRLIAILSMYKLGVHDYVAFLRKFEELFNRGLVSEFELKRGIVSRFSDVIVENYTEIDVQNCLKELKALSTIPPSMKSYIESILSGAALQSKRERSDDLDPNSSR